MPAVALVWPIIVLTEPIAAWRGAAAVLADRARVVLCSSAVSPTTVPVPCASNRPTLAGPKPACAYARRIARNWPAGSGAVRPLALPSLLPPTPLITA